MSFNTLQSKIQICNTTVGNRGVIWSIFNENDKKVERLRNRSLQKEFVVSHIVVKKIYNIFHIASRLPDIEI